MHELSICHSIHRIAARAADGRRVETVHVLAGALRQVVPDTLARCWALVTADGPLEGSQLDVETVPVTLECGPCGALTTLEADLDIACGSCRSRDVTVRTGEELLVTSIDLASSARMARQEPRERKG